MKDTTSAIDIIYQLPSQLSELADRLAALESSNKMLEQKLAAVLSEKKAAQTAAPAAVVAAPIAPPPPAASKQEDDDDAGEVMDIVTPAAPKKKAKAPDNAPFSFSKPVAAPIASAPTEQPTGIKLPYQEVDLNPTSKLPAAQQTSVIVRGRLKERDGIQVNGVEIKIFDSKDICIKKTKTAATGEWLAMLPPADYTLEFSKPGMKPLMKTITVIPGRREMDVLI